jgi:hypothetical protein
MDEFEEHPDRIPFNKKMYIKEEKVKEIIIKYFHKHEQDALKEAILRDLKCN